MALPRTVLNPEIEWVECQNVGGRASLSDRGFGALVGLAHWAGRESAREFWKFMSVPRVNLPLLSGITWMKGGLLSTVSCKSGELMHIVVLASGSGPVERDRAGGDVLRAGVRPGVGIDRVTHRSDLRRRAQRRATGEDHDRGGLLDIRRGARRARHNLLLPAPSTVPLLGAVRSRSAPGNVAPPCPHHGQPSHSADGSRPRGEARGPDVPSFPRNHSVSASPGLGPRSGTTGAFPPPKASPNRVNGAMAWPSFR